MAQAAPEFRLDPIAASLRRQVQERLRRAIITGFFRPGAHLSDRVLSEMFSVSRALVREAVRQLEAEGLIETLPHRGSFVKLLSPDEARQIYAVRGILEALAAKNFALTATDGAIERLDAIFSAIRTAEGETAGDKVLELKQQFYGVLLGEAENAYVRTMLEQIFNRITQLRATSLSESGRLTRTVAELESLMVAIRRRDPEAAWAASLEHVGNAASAAIGVLIRRWDNGPVEDEGNATNGDENAQ